MASNDFAERRYCDPLRDDDLLRLAPVVQRLGMMMRPNKIVHFRADKQGW